MVNLEVKSSRSLRMIM